ncbi:MAG TPA: two-component regulator propeller domain-containing protein, partial [bacterium]
MIRTILLIPPVVVCGQELPFTHYTPENEINPLPSAEVHKVYQDRQGYIWLAVFSSGLIRYDGHAMELYTTDDGLRDLGVWEILEDHLGHLWVGSNTGLVVSERQLSDYNNGERIKFVSTLGAVDLHQATILQNRLAVDARGRLWVGTAADGMIRYSYERHAPQDDESITQGIIRVLADTISTDVRGEGKNLSIRSIVVRKDGSVWAGVGRGMMIVFSTGSPHYEILTAKDGLPDQNINALYETPAGQLWGGCRNGAVWKLEAGNDRRVVTVNTQLQSNVPSILAASDRELWIASEGSGLLKLDVTRPEQGVVYTRKNKLLSDNLHHIMKDREGNLWLAQSGGVSKLRYNYEAFLNYTANSYAGEQPILPSASVNAVLPNVEGHGLDGLWLGTSEGGAVFIRDDGQVERIQTEQGLRNNWVNGLVFDEKGRLWMATAAGINCLTSNPNTPLPASREVNTVSFFGGKRRLAGYRSTSIFSCRSISISSAGNNSEVIESLWFPAYQNLYCLINEEWYVFKELSGLPTTLFHAVAADDDGRLWVGTRDQGLYRSTEAITLPRLRESKKQNVEFQLGRGGGKFGSEIIAPIFEKIWSRAEGAPTNQIETLIWRDNTLWVGTPEGLVVLEGDPP